MDLETSIEAKTAEIIETYQPWIKSLARKEALKFYKENSIEPMPLDEVCSIKIPKAILIEQEMRYRAGYRQGYCDALIAIPSKNLVAKVRAFFDKEVMPWSYFKTGNFSPPPYYKK